MATPTLVYKAYEHLQHWKPLSQCIPAEEIVVSSHHFFPLFSYCYTLAQELYRSLPPRKNGQDAFIHPLNVVWGLKKAHIDDPLTLAVGLLHDYVEERVDGYQRDNNVPKNKMGISLLDAYERKVFKELEQGLKQCCQQHQFSLTTTPALIASLKLLTRHKRHFYYKSISAIFQCHDQELKEQAIQVKLADRLHNILCLDTFGEQERLYQCFKNLFILNNTKHFLLEEYGLEVIHGRVYSATEKLFNKCCRATYDAFVEVCQQSRRKNISEITSMLQLAFHKFALEKSGLWAVTQINDEEVHLLRLYQGVIRKYDARLHHEFQVYTQLKNKELKYCRDFFRDYHFTEQQLQAIISYKDAYALREVIAYLIYQPDYVVSKFLCSELSKEGRIKKKT